MCGLLPDIGYWLPVRDGDARAYAIMQRHYSFQAYADGRRQRESNRNRHLFVGPGRKIVLLGADGRALFVWRKFIDKSGQQGINCAVFRNESDRVASEMILEAESIAWAIWPGERLYTYVDGAQVRGTVPGYCFRRAKWKSAGFTQTRRLLILEKWPSQLRGTAHEDVE